MKRIGIVTLYDDSGVIDEYIEKLLSSLQAEVQKMVIVVNGSVNKESLEKLRCYTDEIFFRENIGFDAGAYKDALLRFVPQGIWEKYDEIILMNDTFYGFIHPIKYYLNKFEAEAADFWGFTRHPEMQYSGNGGIASHIQAYFLAVRKSIFTDPCFLEFWEGLPYPQTYQRAVIDFEIGFTTYFERKGFRSKSWMDLYGKLTWWKSEGNPYILHSYELIKDLYFPIFKKKCLQLESEGYINALQTLEYMEAEGKYDTKLIWDNIFRLCRENVFRSVLNYDRLENFYVMHDHIYIYGAGKYGKRIQKYFQYRNWKFECFLVSDHADNNLSCKKYGEINFVPKDGIILALGKAAFEEVYPVVAKKVDDMQMFLLQYD